MGLLHTAGRGLEGSGVSVGVGKDEMKRRWRCGGKSGMEVAHVFDNEDADNYRDNGDGEGGDNAPERSSWRP
jgi:hypothetical protein